MRRLVRVVLLLISGTVAVWLLAGCSGTGAPTEPGGLTELQAIANDQVTAALFVTRWARFLYGTAGAGSSGAADACRPDSQQVPSQPGDPPGSARYVHTWPDCTTVEEFVLADGSSTEVRHGPDGHDSTFAFGPVREEGGWTVRSARAGFWDGAVLEFETASIPFSPVSQKRKSGTATLADGRQMTFLLNRDRYQDVLEVRPDDASEFGMTVPFLQEWPPNQPAYKGDSKGTFRSPAGRTMEFELTGNSDTRWQHWTLKAEDGTTGVFALDSALGGRGELRLGGRLQATLTWTPDGSGKLQPVGGGELQALPSAAARDFSIDQWIRGIAALGPTPRY